MARNVRSGPLESRTSRSKLPSRNAPYWCVLSPSVALGYRKGARGGAWLARLHDDETGRRLQEKIGKADDTLDADGLTVLSFPQAQAKVREWAAVKAREMSGEVPSAGPYTVADAIRDYLNWFDRHRKGGDATRFAVNAFKWVSMIVRLSRRVGLFLWDEGVRPFSRRDGAGLSWRCRAAARLRE